MVIGVEGIGGPILGATIGFSFSDAALEAGVGANLNEVEERLREVAVSADPVVEEAAQHLVRAGGKRFRPLLVAICSHFGDPLKSNVVLAGTLVELTHLATLYHDDVMDEAPVRRGAPSANARWGNSVAILVGDYLFARAAYLAADLGIEAVRLQAGTFSRLVQGQIAETVGPRDGEDKIGHHLRVIGEKTASLIAASAKFGALFAGAPPEAGEHLVAYGNALGMAFQLSDDLLDIASETVKSGKTPGTDLREGVLTLPMLYALADDSCDPDAQRLREILVAGPVTDEALHAEALGLLRGSQALKRARGTMQEYASAAKEALVPLPNVAARQALVDLCDYIADRNG
jgi:heptaprenyl diphosphate synthase